MNIPNFHLKVILPTTTVPFPWDPLLFALAALRSVPQAGPQFPYSSIPILSEAN